ncbi:glycoside hydrolase superfamily [Tribonema minus]|uniref:Glycoside hydrolase superfamily n=1 Tax=Tribonema minus TaxID=303371 RepID=A0A835YZH6_9STRA|nr:glycoside hydrolase superfamily [Tribonema minus]
MKLFLLACLAAAAACPAAASAQQEGSTELLADAAILSVSHDSVRLEVYSGEDEGERLRTRRAAAKKILAPVPMCSAAGLAWTSKGGEVLLNGRPFHIKGTHWFGLESGVQVLHGLWGDGTTMKQALDFLQANKFNALRVPVSLDTVLNAAAKPDAQSCLPANCGALTTAQLLSQLFKECAARGILVLLDMHYLNTPPADLTLPIEEPSPAPFPRNTLLDLYGAEPNLLGIDLKNEPHGTASWGIGQRSTDWAAAAVRIVQGIRAKHPGYNKLIFIEGISTGRASSPFPAARASYDMNWGMNLDGAYANPVVFTGRLAYLNDKVVYSPHVYGPSVFNQTYYADPTFPKNMAAIWDQQIGGLEAATGKAVVVGEWGGLYIGTDRVLQDALGAYLKSKCIADAFWWANNHQCLVRAAAAAAIRPHDCRSPMPTCPAAAAAVPRRRRRRRALNPNSAEMGGLLQADWRTPNAGKLALLAAAQPTPSLFVGAIGRVNICVNYGAYGNALCDKRTGVRVRGRRRAALLAGGGDDDDETAADGAAAAIGDSEDSEEYEE